MAKTAKLKTALYKNKLFVALFVLLFSGIGAYALINSHAATTTGTAWFRFTSTAGGAGVGEASIRIDSVGGSTTCYYNAGYTRTGVYNFVTSDGNGNAFANCLATHVTSSGTVNDRTYYIYDIYPPAGWVVSNGGYQKGNYITLHAGSTDGPFNIYLVPSGCGDGTQNNTCPPPPAPTPSGCGSGTLNDQCVSISSFTADSYSLANGGSTTLRWSTSWATGCNINGVGVGVNSTYPTGGLGGPKNYTYTLACSGSNSNASKQLVIAVAAPNQPPPPPPPQPTSGGSGGGGGSTSGTTSTTKKPAASTPAVANDSVPPTAPTNLSAFQSGPGSVDLSWDASTDNIGVDHYMIERSTDGSTWSTIDNEISDVSYSDVDIAFNTQYFYRVYALDLAGNKSPASTTADITTQSFEANVTADKGATIKSDDGFVVAEIPSQAVTEDAFCEVTKDSTRLTPPKLKLVAGSYQINCKNATGDDITSFDKDASITMKLKTFKGYKNFKAYTIGDTNLKLINATLNKNDQSLHFKQSDLQAFAAYGNKKGSGLLFWLLLPFILAGAAFALLRYRNSRPDNTYYDTSGYVSMPPTAPVTPSSGYEHHASLPELVAQGQQQAPPQAHDPFAAPVPPQYQQPGPYALPPQPQPPQPQDPNQPQPPQQ